MLLIKLGPYLKVGYIIKSSTHNKNEIKNIKIKQTYLQSMSIKL